MENKIKKILFEMGVPTHVKGYEYLVEGVKLVCQEGKISICESLYPKIAEKYTTKSVHSVEKGIKYAIKLSLPNCPTHLKQEVLKNRIKVSNSVYIYLVAEYLKLKEEI